MAAEYEILHAPRAFKNRGIARKSRALLSDVFDELGGTSNPKFEEEQRLVPLTPPEVLFRILGKSSLLYKGYIDETLTCFESTLLPESLAKNIEKLNALDEDQRSVLTYAVAPKFAEAAETSASHFIRGYELFAGLLTHKQDSAFSTWPVEIEDMFLDGVTTNQLGSFMIDLTRKARLEQPYVADFALGGAWDYFVNADSGKPKDDFDKVWRERMVLSGIGLASLHFENMVLPQALEAIELANLSTHH